VNNSSQRFLSVLCLVALGGISSPLVAQQVLSSGAATGVANAQRDARANLVAYSADQVSEMTQTLADGTKITHKYLAKVYRDSQGRTRYENFGTHAESGGAEDLPVSISIYDPVAGIGYNLKPGDHTAERYENRKPTSSPATRTAGASASLAPARPPLPTREDLGTQVIEGLEAKGTRITRTIPEGAEGNDRPIEITTETWFSVKGNIVLLRITNDPRRGETKTYYTNLVLDEPPAELFQVPADYALKELQPVAKPEPPSE
jgi:hypothetical protein